MTTKTQVFFTGATGYIGGSVLARLLDHHTFPFSEITALLRPSQPDRSAALHSLGVKTVQGTNSDLEVLERQASQSDAVFSCADSDDLPACEAILRGLKKRHETTGTVPVLIHTVSSIFIDDMKCNGNYSSEKIWDDMKLDELDTIPDTNLHRNVDVPILAADKEGYVKTYIVHPSAVCGLAKGKLAHVQNTRSAQIPTLIKASLDRNPVRVGIVGKGENIWPNVHIDDLAELYMVLYDAILSGKAGHGREGLYFAENGEIVLKSICQKIAQGAKTPCASGSTDADENHKLVMIGTNSRCKGNRARALGWKPRYTIEDMLNTVEEDVKDQLMLRQV
ncbi:hypothetical protein F5I97DRAFT_1937284 [Phlebopus sp. FC_14]|nr:hypothetical protein F5I97DRAFT_1937284 [Phlebopus sp. FC_14]